MVEELPNLLFLSFVVAVVLMSLAIYCAVTIFRIARKFLNEIYEADINLYKKLVGADGTSWIDRKTDSIADSALWWKLYKFIYHGGDDELTIDSRTRSRFVLCVRLMITFFVISLFVAILVILIGFRLSS
jgi:hypothetical protein